LRLIDGLGIEKSENRIVLDEDCRDLKTWKAIEGMRRKRFCSPEHLARVWSIGVPSSSVTLQIGMSILSRF